MITIKCKFCGILLSGREQFIGHMVNHDIDLEQLNGTWEKISNAPR